MTVAITKISKIDSESYVLHNSIFELKQLAENLYRDHSNEITPIQWTNVNNLVNQLNLDTFIKNVSSYEYQLELYRLQNI